jgi:hypothetical protein
MQACHCGRRSPLVRMSASWREVGTRIRRMYPFWIASRAKCLRMSMCLARSRPPMTLIPHSIVLKHIRRLALTESHAIEEVPDIHDFGCSCGSRVILCLSRRESRCLLHLRSPHDGRAVIHDHVAGRGASRFAVAPVGIGETGEQIARLLAAAVFDVHARQALEVLHQVMQSGPLRCTSRCTKPSELRYRE